MEQQETSKKGKQIEKNSFHADDPHTSAFVTCTSVKENVRYYEELIALPYNNDLAPWVMGFGYVPSTKEFKVLAYFSDCFNVLTLGTDQWRDVEDPPLLVNLFHNPGGAFVDGAIHFLSKPDNGIASFNLEREEWASITPPLVSQCYSQSLIELSAHLCLGRHNL